MKGMRRTKTTRTRPTTTKLETRNPPRHNNPPIFSFPPGNEMTGLGLFGSSFSSSSSTSTSTSTSSNLSPLALPFTVERSNPNKFNLASNPTTQGFVADSITTATVPSTYSTFPNPNNRSSVPAVNACAIGPNHRATDASFNAPGTHNWSSMNSGFKLGLGPIKPPAGNLFGVNPNTQPQNKWSLGSDVGDNDAPVMPIDFSLLPSRSLFQDYGSSQVSYNQSLSGSKYSGQADGSRGKQDSSFFGGVFGVPVPVTRENNIGPSVIGKSHDASSSATDHGLVSTGFSNEHTFTWNDSTSHYPFETRSIFYDSSSDQLSPSVTTKSLDIRSTSPLTKINLLVSHSPLKEKEPHNAVGFEYKSSLDSQVLETSSIKEVNSAANLSDHLDHHNPGEDSPCWKGAPTHFSSTGSHEQESSQHPVKKLQKNSAEDDLFRAFHGTVENAATAVTSGSLDVKMVVETLNNLSEILLHLYSKDECRLKEHDHKALDQVIANLNVCLSCKNPQVDPTVKCSSHQQITTNVSCEERNNDPFGKNIEEPRVAYVRNEGLQKDYNMVQKIKRVLDEDLEFKEDLPSDPLLYKNLWLEAEAELCVSSYKTRLHRAKREMGKSKAIDLSGVASNINISSSYVSPTDPKLSHEAAACKISNTHAPNISLPIVDDVENSVMARFNILKRREESNPVNMAEKEPASVIASGYKAQSSGVADGSQSQHLLDKDDVVMHSHGTKKMQGSLAEEDVGHAVMARLNILKSRGEVDHVSTEHSLEHGVSADGGRAQVSEGVLTSTTQNQFGSFSAYNASSFGWEYVLDG